MIENWLYRKKWRYDSRIFRHLWLHTEDRFICTIPQCLCSIIELKDSKMLYKSLGLVQRRTELIYCLKNPWWRGAIACSISMSRTSKNTTVCPNTDLNHRAAWDRFHHYLLKFGCVLVVSRGYQWSQPYKRAQCPFLYTETSSLLGIQTTPSFYRSIIFQPSQSLFFPSISGPGTISLFRLFFKRSLT